MKKKRDLNQFQPRHTFNLIIWNCSIVYFVLAYLMALPSSTTVTWNALNKTFKNQEINNIYLQYTFIIGACVSVGLEITGNLRQKILKCDLLLTIALIIQIILPITEGALIMRFILGIAISLNIKYTEIYLHEIIYPVNVYLQRKYPGHFIFTFQLYLKNQTSFCFGWALCTILAAQLPQVKQLQYIKMYDDTILWTLLNALPIIFIIVRIILMKFNYNYDTITENQFNEDANETFLANIFKKKDVEETWGMLHASEFYKELKTPYYENHTKLLLLTSQAQFCGTILLMHFSYDMLKRSLPSTYINTISNLSAIIATVAFLAQFKTYSLLTKMHCHTLRTLCLLTIPLIMLAFLGFRSLEFKVGIIASLVALGIANILGPHNTQFCYNYYICHDESSAFKFNLIRFLSIGFIDVLYHLIGINVLYLFCILPIFFIIQQEPNIPSIFNLKMKQNEYIMKVDLLEEKIDDDDI